MFKLTEFCNDPKRTGFALQFMTPYEWNPDKPRNLLHIRIWKWSWWIETPALIKPQFKWVDLSDREWATVGPTGKKGYTDDIQREYGFSSSEGSFHLYYGIQPGSWSKDDPKNSDHSKVFFYCWNMNHVRHSIYDHSGNYLCNGDHFREWTNTTRKPFNKETKNSDFEDIPEFIYPIDDTIEPGYFLKRGEYQNWSDKTRSGSEIYKIYDYTDYDGKMTRAKCYVEELEWQKGKWAWLRAILKHFPDGRSVRRSLHIEFRDEIGQEKGSWKGGTMGTGIDMLPNERIDDAWTRFKIQQIGNRK